MLVHSVTAEGFDTIEEGIECIEIIIGEAYKGEPIPPHFWDLYTKVLNSQNNSESNFIDSEYVNAVVDLLVTFIYSDPKGMLNVSQGQTDSHLK